MSRTRSTALERLVIILLGGLNRFYGIQPSPWVLVRFMHAALDDVQSSQTMVPNPNLIPDVVQTGSEPIYFRLIQIASKFPKNTFWDPGFSYRNDLWNHQTRSQVCVQHHNEPIDNVWYWLSQWSPNTVTLSSVRATWLLRSIDLYSMKSSDGTDSLWMIRVLMYPGTRGTLGYP